MLPELRLCLFVQRVSVAELAVLLDLKLPRLRLLVLCLGIIAVLAVFT